MEVIKFSFFDPFNGMDSLSSRVMCLAFFKDVFSCKDSNYKPNISEAEFDFNLGYAITVVTAIFFLTLGAITMYGTGDGMLTGSGVSFAQKLILLYTKSIGEWSKWIIIPAAFAAMFSTTITCLDAYPRSISCLLYTSPSPRDS